MRATPPPSARTTTSRSVAASARPMQEPRNERPSARLRRALRQQRCRGATGDPQLHRSEEHTYELQSLMRISYAVFCLKKNNKQIRNRLLYTPYSQTTT